MTEASTPLMRQYQSIKKRYPHALVLFRLGDFYELFSRGRHRRLARAANHPDLAQPREGRAHPHVRRPHHAAETYIARLLRAGYKIAVCDQMEQPGPGKKLVRRDVVRVITPGTATDLQVLEPKRKQFSGGRRPRARPAR